MYTAASIAFAPAQSSRAEPTAALQNVIAEALRALAAELEWAADLESHLASLHGGYRLWLAIAARLTALNLAAEERTMVRRNCVFTIETLRTAGINDFKVDALVSISLGTANLLDCGARPSDRPLLELIEELESWRMAPWG